MPLVEGGEAQEVGAWAVVGDGPPTVPRDGRDVIAHGMRGRVAAGSIGGNDILVEDGSGQFQIGVRDGAGGVGIGDEQRLDVGRPLRPPQKRLRAAGGRRAAGGGVWRKPHATGAGLRGVTRAYLGRSRWDDLRKASGAGGNVLSQLPKIFDLIPGVLVEAEACAVGVPEGTLEV